MSFDVFLQRFRPGDQDTEALIDLLRPYLVASKEGHFDLHFDDGSAAIYGLGLIVSGFMVSHISGRQAWELLVEVARHGDLTIMPVGCPAAVTSEELLADLPEELKAEARVIRTGDDLIRLIESS